MSFTTSLRFTPSFSKKVRFLLDPLKGIRENVEVFVEYGVLVSLKEGIVGPQDLLLLPPLTDAHTHMELEGLRGRVGRKRLFRWILDLVGKREPYPDGIRDALYRRFFEGVLYIGEISSLGIDRGVSVSIPARIRFYLEFIRDFEEPEVGNDIGVSPHAVYSSSEEVFKKVCRFSREKKIPFTMHLLEAWEEETAFKGKMGELEELYRFFGVKRTFPYSSLEEYLEKQGAFAAYNPSFVHLTYAREKLFERIASIGGYAVVCPSSNLFIERRLPPLPSMLEVMGPERIGIGCDSIASGITGSLWEEMRILYLFFDLDPMDVIKMAVVGGRRAVGYRYWGFSEDEPFEGVFIKIPPSLGRDEIGVFLMTVKEEDVVGIATERGVLWKG